MASKREREREPERVGLVLSVRMKPEHVAVFLAVEGGETQTEAGKTFGFSRQRVYAVCRRGERILRERRPPSADLAAELSAIEAEACAQAGYRTVGQVRTALVDDTMPKWMPAEVILALAKRFGVPVPDRAIRKVARLVAERERAP